MDRREGSKNTGESEKGRSHDFHMIGGHGGIDRCYSVNQRGPSSLSDNGCLRLRLQRICAQGIRCDVSGTGAIGNSHGQIGPKVSIDHASGDGV